MQSSSSDVKNVRKAHGTPRFLKMFGILRGHPKAPPPPSAAANTISKHLFNVNALDAAYVSQHQTKQDPPAGVQRRLNNDRLARHTKRFSALFPAPSKHEDSLSLSRGKRQSCVVVPHDGSLLSADDTPNDWHIIQQQDLVQPLATSSPSNVPQDELVKNQSVVNEHVECEAKLTELRAELEKEKTTVSALQKQKEGLTKDLQYCNRIAEEATQEKLQLAQQLEIEKVNMRHMEENINILQEKMRAANVEARNRSRDADHYKKELEEARSLSDHERTFYNTRLKEKDDQISEMDARIEKTDHELASLRELLSQQKQHFLEQQQHLLDQQEYMQKQMSQERQHTAMDSNMKNHIKQADEPTSPRCTGDNTIANQKTDEHLHVIGDLDIRLRELTEEKERLQSAYSKIPISGGSRFTRRRKEELEEKLDKVDVQLCRVKHRLRGRIV